MFVTSKLSDKSVIGYFTVDDLEMNTEGWFCLKEIFIQARFSAKPGSDKPVLNVAVRQDAN